MTTPADSNGFVSLAVTGDSSLVISKLSESLLGISASISGFFMIYLVPVMAYMKMKKIEI